MIRIIRENAKDAFLRRESAMPNVAPAVSKIISEVRTRGDEAVIELTEKFDGVRVSSLEVSCEEWDACADKADPKVVEALRRAACNIRAFHENQKRTGFVMSGEEGVLLGQRVLPLKRAGVYVPGGTASYPSTVLMDCIPAKIAGVEEVLMATPPGKDGRMSPNVMAAARIAGVDRVFRMGGAQAVAALAFGTKSVPAVDKIVGPGNVFVAEAKRQVSGRVGIDMFAGPSEILIIADGEASASHAAADMLSQAEHDKLASAILITDSEALAQEVSGQIEAQLELLPRKEIARASIDGGSMIIVIGDMDEAVEIANDFAPEHLELCVEDPFAMLSRVRNAGSVFLGKSCPEAVGDYYAGANHTLPTSGTARFSSPLGVDDFIKRSSFIYYGKDALSKAAADIETLAEAEGLQAHARSVTVRTEK